MLIDIVVAACRDYNENFTGIGYGNNIPWISSKFSEDLLHFKNLTQNSVVIMGRLTHESIGKILPDRVNIVIGSQFKKKIPGVFYARTSDDAIRKAKELGYSSVFVIGGSEIYKHFLEFYKVSKIYLSAIDEFHVTDRHFYVPKNFTLSFTETKKLSDNVELQVYNGENKAEMDYIDLIHDILETGVEKNDRTGVGTFSTFGNSLKFNLQEGFPLLTTKKVPWQMVLKELLWFLSGSTDARELQKQGVHIWDGNTSREFLDNCGLHHYREGDLGAMYGFQFRHYGAEYINCETDYGKQGFDQIYSAIKLIKEDPDSRRIIITSWNPSDRKIMCLYPCHGLIIQFFVRDCYLDCQMYQRSADMGLGVPFNIASYAFLTHMFAHVCDLSPGRLTIVFGDTHIYNNHIEPLETQVKRTPYPFPRLKINRKVEDIFDFKLEDFTIEDYRYYPGIKMMMAV